MVYFLVLVFAYEKGLGYFLSFDSRVPRSMLTRSPKPCRYASVFETRVSARACPILKNACFRTSQILVGETPVYSHNDDPPFPKQRSDGFPFDFLRTQTDLRTLICKQTLPKLRTNRIMNKWACLK